MAANCHIAEYICCKCHKKGDLAKVCRSQKSASGDRRNTGEVKAHQLTLVDCKVEEVPLLRLEKGHPTPIMG